MKLPTYSKDAACDAARLLPRLSMDEYVAFLAESMSQADPASIARQKALEKQITVPFRLVPVRENVRPLSGRTEECKKLTPELPNAPSVAK